MILTVTIFQCKDVQRTIRGVDVSAAIEYKKATCDASFTSMLGYVILRSLHTLFHQTPPSP